MRKTKLTLMLITLTLCGCASKPASVNEVQRLRAHPQYREALTAAPEWTADALRTINTLQLEKAKLEAEK